MFNSNDVNDALNVSAGGANIYGGVTIGNNGFQTNDQGQITSPAVIKNTLTVNGNITTPGNVTASYLFGNAQYLTGLSAGQEVQTFQNVTTGNGTTSNQITITNNDIDDAFNVSIGAVYFGNKVKISGSNQGGNIVFNIYEIFNITDRGNIVLSETGGGDSKLTLKGTDQDDVLNVSTGGAYFGGKVAITNTDQNIALNVTGGATFNKKITLTTNQGGDVIFNINDIFTITDRGNIVLSETGGGDSKLTLKGNDNDDVFNVSSGGAYFGNQVTFNNNIMGSNPGANINWNGKISTTSNDNDDALNVTNGGAKFGNINVQNQVNAGILQSTGQDPQGHGLDVNNGAMFRSNNANWAVNVSQGGANIFGGLTVGNNGLNIGTSGDVKSRLLISNNDGDDALNVSAGSSFIKGNETIQGGVLIIGGGGQINPTGKNNHLTINDGGSPTLCPYIQLTDGPAGWFIFVNSTGTLRMHTSAPTTCSNEGVIIGTQT
ncbi:MAG: hypothetical protein WC254_05360 [Candidatus Woesearchaeota archaeon]